MRTLSQGSGQYRQGEESWSLGKWSDGSGTEDGEIRLQCGCLADFRATEKAQVNPPRHAGLCGCARLMCLCLGDMANRQLRTAHA